MLRVSNVAIPVDPVTALNVPDTVPPPGLVPIAIVTVTPAAGVTAPVTARTDTSGEMASPNTVFVGCETTARLATPAVVIVMLSARVATAGGADTSWTCTVNGKVPAAVGVPEINPLALSVRPGGSVVPDARLHV